jgi:lipoate synthase
MLVSLQTILSNPAYLFDVHSCRRKQGGRMMARNLKMASQKVARPRLPPWFRTTLPSGSQQAMFNDTLDAVKDNQLHTVCQEARCPNIHECWSSGDATFMIAGKGMYSRMPILCSWHA